MRHLMRNFLADWKGDLGCLWERIQGAYECSLSMPQGTWTWPNFHHGAAAGVAEEETVDIANSITFIEWGGAESARLIEDRLEITIDRSDDERKVEVKPVGSRWTGFSL